MRSPDPAPPPAAFTASRPAPTTGCRRQRSPASRWQAAAPISASPLAAAGDPTCSRPAHSSSTRSARPMSARPQPMAGMTSRPIARSRSQASTSCARASPPTPSRAVSKAAIAIVTPWFGGLGLTPYAAAQVTTTRLPAYAETVVSGANAFALSYLAKDVTAPRTELGLRSDKSFAVNDAMLTLRGRAAWAHDFNPHQRGLGDVPGAARRKLCGQRRGGSARCGADDGLGRNEMAERRLARRDVRRRVLRRHPLLRRQERRKLYGGERNSQCIVADYSTSNMRCCRSD